MSRRLLTGNAAAAWGARLAGVDYVPAFPITPQTEIIENLGYWIDSGQMDARMVTLESEHSMITAAGAAAATGVRVFCATSSQGLLYGMEMLYTVAGWRAPFVLVNVSRGLAAPITLESDHNDIMAARDCGFLQIHCCSCQEVLDASLIAYRVAEDPRVRLPVIVNMDGFYLSFTREPVDLPEAELAARYLSPFAAHGVRFRASSPISQAVAVLGGTPYSYFRYETHLAMLNGEAAFKDAAGDFAELFGRDYQSLENYRCEDAEYVFLMLGSFASKGREAVDRLREAGWRIGLLRPRLLRPFPENALREALRGKRAVAIIDQNISMGKGGVLHTEVMASLYGQADMPAIVAGFIGGLGGRDIIAEEFFKIADTIKQAAEVGECPPPRLLYTRGELRELRKLQAVAHVEREDLAAQGTDANE